MLILMYIMLSGIKMTDFGAPRILMTMETWGIILPAPHVAKQRLPASVVSFPILSACTPAALPSHMRKQRREHVAFGDLTMKQRFAFLIPAEIRRHSDVFSRSSSLF